MGFQKFFEYLGARLKAQWSWGSVATSGDIFLAVWEADMDRAKNRVLVFDSEPDRSHGLPERASHLQLIRSEHRDNPTISPAYVAKTESIHVGVSNSISRR